MPIRIKNGLPVKEKLERENLFVIDETRAIDQDIRPLEICILNLMPTKEETELQLLRMLSNTPLQLNVTFMRMSSHQSVNVSASHLMHFYYSFQELRHRTFDGLIITDFTITTAFPKGFWTKSFSASTHIRCVTEKSPLSAASTTIS